MNKGIKAALALGLCCVTAAGLFGCTKAAPEETTQPATVATRPAATMADTTMPESTTNASTDTTTKPAETTTKKAKEDSGSAYTVNQALDALTNYYGKGYDVDGTVSEGNNYYFAVYKKKEVRLRQSQYADRRCGRDPHQGRRDGQLQCICIRRLLWIRKSFISPRPFTTPSGNPHIGHCYTTVACDSIARFRRMQRV